MKWHSTICHERRVSSSPGQQLQKQNQMALSRERPSGSPYAQAATKFTHSLISVPYKCEMPCFPHLPPKCWVLSWPRSHPSTNFHGNPFGSFCQILRQTNQQEWKHVALCGSDEVSQMKRSYELWLLRVSGHEQIRWAVVSCFYVSSACPKLISSSEPWFIQHDADYMLTLAEVPSLFITIIKCLIDLEWHNYQREFR